MMNFSDIDKLVENMDKNNLLDELNKQVGDAVNENWEDSKGIRLSFLGILQHKLVGAIEEYINDESTEALEKIRFIYSIIKLFRDDLE